MLEWKVGDFATVCRTFTAAGLLMNGECIEAGETGIVDAVITEYDGGPIVEVFIHLDRRHPDLDWVSNHIWLNEASDLDWGPCFVRGMSPRVRRARALKALRTSVMMFCCSLACLW